MGKGVATILLLLVSNVLMILAWYGHLKFAQVKPFSQWGLFGIILSSWLIAFFEYCVQVPANRIGFNGNGGPFSLLQLKIIQEVLTLIVFVVFSALVFKSEPLKWNHLAAFLCLVLAVYFAFK
ncbi:MAG: DMT family protein [Bacteroidales bacterium]|nr:DMT family protein [Candidatus Cacconaster merdequi]